MMGDFLLIEKHFDGDKTLIDEGTKKEMKEAKKKVEDVTDNEYVIKKSEDVNRSDLG